eukprot:jgi/Botrbrau1/20213/Bobra.31_1s0010.1
MGCTSGGVRKYSSQLLNIPSGWDWYSACTSMPAVFWAKGRYYTLNAPNVCETRGGEWGDFFVDDPTCGPKGFR